MFYVIYEKDTPRLNFRRVPRAFSTLLINIHRHAGLEFHNKFILIDADFFDQPADKLLVVFSEGGGLLF